MSYRKHTEISCYLQRKIRREKAVRIGMSLCIQRSKVHIPFSTLTSLSGRTGSEGKTQRLTGVAAEKVFPCTKCSPHRTPCSLRVRVEWTQALTPSTAQHWASWELFRFMQLCPSFLHCVTLYMTWSLNLQPYVSTHFRGLNTCMCTHHHCLYPKPCNHPQHTLCTR